MPHSPVTLGKGLVYELLVGHNTEQYRGNRRWEWAPSREPAEAGSPRLERTAQAETCLLFLLPGDHCQHKHLMAAAWPGGFHTAQGYRVPVLTHVASQLT